MKSHNISAIDFNAHRNMNNSSFLQIVENINEPDLITFSIHLASGEKNTGILCIDVWGNNTDTSDIGSFQNMTSNRASHLHYSYECPVPQIKVFSNLLTHTKTKTKQKHHSVARKQQQP